MTRVSALVVALVLVPLAAAGQTTIFTVQQPGGPPLIISQPGMPGQPPRDNQPKTGTARIRGHVFAGDTGQPLRKAQVRIFAPELRENRLATTDAQGAYEFKDLPAGRYTLNASKGSYVNLQYGQTRPNEGGKPLQILDAQTIEKVDFSLPRGSIILGRVIDEFGEPVTDVQVMPMRSQFVQGRRRLMPTGRSAQTNDIGEYRIFGLAPGQYYISATLRNMNFGVADSDEHSGYAPTYYPGTANMTEAQRVTVGIGETLAEINLGLVVTRTAKVSGTAVNAQGKPMVNGMVMVMQREASGMGMSSGGQIKPDGSFTVTGLAPGDYVLRANAMNTGGPMLEIATATVTVNGEDVSGVQLAVAKMVSGTGRIVVRDPAAAQTLKPTGLRVMAQPASPDDMMMMMGGPNGGEVKDDFSFEIKTAPGRFNLRIGSPMPGFGLKAVRLNGVDVTDTGVDFTPAGDVSGIEIELTNHPQEVSGLVTNARGEPQKNYSVVVFAQDREKWTGNSRYMTMSRPDQDGRFKIRSLPPGSYYVVALDYVDPGEMGDPEFLERVRVRATSISLGEGETKTLDLKLNTAS